MLITSLSNLIAFIPVPFRLACLKETLKVIFKLLKLYSIVII